MSQGYLAGHPNVRSSRRCKFRLPNVIDHRQQTWFYSAVDDRFARFSPYLLGRPTATALEIALEMHLRELEHQGKFVQPTCTCSPFGCSIVSGLRSAKGLSDGVEQRETRRESRLRDMDKYTKAIYHVLAVRDLTFRPGMDPCCFTTRHDTNRHSGVCQPS